MPNIKKLGRRMPPQSVKMVEGEEGETYQWNLTDLFGWVG